MHELIIVGAGPCGIAAALSAQRAGLDYLVLEKGSVGHAMTHYPVYMEFFSTPEKLEIGGVPFVTQSDHPTKTEALKYYRRIAEHNRLQIRQWEKVVGARRTDQGFVVETQAKDGTPLRYETRNLAIATGYFDHPNLLGVPGEDDPKLCLHTYTEPGPFYGQDVVIVGGRNSAVDAALDLYRNGARVTLVHRGPGLSDKVKPWILPDITNRLKSGEIRSYFNTVVKAIHPGRIQLEQDGRPLELPCDFVFALTGYHPDHTVLRNLGVEIDPMTGRPVHNPETMETNVPGLFVIGVIAAGYDANKIFIENGRDHGDLMVPAILKKRSGSSTARGR